MGKENFVEGELNPFNILFSQCNINIRFKNGGLIEDLIRDLVNGSIKVDDIETIKVCIIDGEYYSFDNRRLYCFQEAIRWGASFKKIPVVFCKENENIKENLV